MTNDADQTVVTMDSETFATLFREELEKIEKKKQNDEKKLEGC